MRLNATRLGSIASSRSFGDQLDDLAGQVPSLDLNFAQNKSLIDDYSGTTLVTFTRASSGTYVDSQGVIRTAVTNLLLRSEEFDDPQWNIPNSSITVDPNVTVSPDGSQTADKVKEATTTGGHSIECTGFAFQSGTIYTVSFYAKAAERSRFRVAWPTMFTNRLVFVDISPGGYGVISDGGTVTSVSPAGNDWFRVVSTSTCTTTTTGARVGITLIDTGTNVNYTGDGTSGIYFWGAQLEQSSTVGEYIPTTSTINSAPRFDHNPTTGESLGLLVEEARTNGALTADRLLETTATSLHACDGTAITFVTSTVYTYSVFVNSIGGRNFEIAFPATLFTARFARFTLSGTGSVQGVDSGVTASIQALANGWYRCSASSTCVLTAGSRMGNFINNASYSRSYTGDITKGIYIWGAQMEAGAFPTSYIPTVAATVTRAADVASITGANFSSWYRQDEGTVFAAYQGREGNASKRVFAFTDDSSSNIAWLIASNSVGSQANYWQVRAGGVVQAELGSGAYSAVPQLSAAAYRADDFGFSKNGGAPLTDTSGSIPVVNTLRIGAGPANTDILNGAIRRLTYWPTRLGNEVLQRITQ
jgi:hypothetical protein